jgi:hypothetical protein
MSTIPTLNEFLSTARREFSFLVSELGFTEQSDQGQGPNPFSVYYTNATTAVRVEGVQWGVSIQVMLICLSPATGCPATVPLWVLVQLRTGCEQPIVPGQLAQMVRDADLLPLHAHDVLRGDFSVFPAAYSLMMQIHEGSQEPRKRVLP